MSKKKIIASSILSLAMCASVITGATFALFTSESENNISINAGNVKLVATLNLTGTSSMGVDMPVGTFENGGTVSIDEGMITLERMTPGDKAEFEVLLDNQSDVAIQYQTIVKQVSDTGLFDGLEIMIEGEEFTTTKVSDWISVAANAQPADSVIEVSVELPEDAGDEYQGTSTQLSVAVNAVQGNATTENPDVNTTYIYTASDLVTFANSVNAGNTYKGKTVVLSADIDLANQEWDPIGQTGNVSFAGIFDGNSHKIKNLYVDTTDEEKNGVFASGLFGWIEEHTDSVQIKNVTIDGANINGNYFAGGIVGYINGAGAVNIIDNCHVINATISGSKYDAGGTQVGGIVGSLWATNVTNCSVKNSTLNSLTIGEYDTVGEVSGWVGADATADESNTHNDVTINTDILHVGTLEELVTFAHNVNSGYDYANKTVKLTADIDLNNEEWTPIGNRSSEPFSGSFDGQGYTISNLYINKEIGNIAASNRQGLFGTIVPSGATYFQNLTLHNANVQGGYHVGAVIAKSDNSSQTYTSNYLVVTDIQLTGNVRVEGWQGVGGVMGSGNMAEMSNITVDVEPGSYVSNTKGGPDWSFNIVGSVKGGGYLSKIDNIKSNMDVKGISCSIGGLFGVVGGQNTVCAVSNVSYSGTVTVKASVDAHVGLYQYQYNGLIIGAPRFNVTADQTTCTSNGKLVLNTEEGTKTSNDMGSKYNWGVDLFGASRDTTYNNKSYAKDYTGS